MHDNIFDFSIEKHLGKMSLYGIIQSLTPDEKKGLRKQLRRKGEKSQTFQLYETITGCGNYDEEEIKNLLKRRIPLSSFSVIKNHLTEDILSYLNSVQTSVNARIREWLDYVNVLITKNLFEEALVYCDKVCAEAWRQGHLYFIIEANYRKASILQYTQKENFQQSIDLLSKISFRITELMALTFKCALYYYKVTSLLHEEDNVRSYEFTNKITELKNDPLFSLNAESPDYPFYAACYLAMAKNYLYRYSCEFENAYLQEKIVWQKLRRDWNFFLTHRPREVMSSIVNYLHILLLTANEAELESVATLADNLLKNEFNGNKYLTTYMTSFRLERSLILRDKIKPALIGEFVSYYESGQVDNFIDLKKLIEFNLGRAFFYIGDYRSSHLYLSHILHEYKNSEVRYSAKEYALFMTILLEFTELLSDSFQKAKQGIGHYTDIYYNHIRRYKDHNYSIERLFISFFNSINQDITRSQLLDRIEKLRQTLSLSTPSTSIYIFTMHRNFDFDFVLNRWSSLIQKA